MSFTRSDFWKGAKAGLPILLGYLPYGVAYGFLAKQASLSLFQTLLMSSVVYAGSAQIVVVAMIQANQTVLAIVMATLMINLRYVLMMSALSQSMKSWNRWMRFMVSYYVSDETFVVLSKKAKSHSLSAVYSLGVNSCALLGWCVSSFLGFSIGHFFNFESLGFDFALIAALITLAVLMIHTRVAVVVAAAAGIGALLLAGTPFERVSVLAAALGAAMLGMGITWMRTRST